MDLRNVYGKVENLPGDYRCIKLFLSLYRNIAEETITFSTGAVRSVIPYG